MLKLKNFGKKLLFPITLMTIVAFLGIVLSIQALYVAFTNDHTAAIYAAVIIPLTIVALLLYAIDRVLVRKISYLMLLILEATALVILYFIFFRS